MTIILVLIPLSLILLAAGVWAFFWGVNNAQFDDLDTPALIPLADDPPAVTASHNASLPIGREKAGAKD